jgi:hypothetical protein
MLLAFFAAPRLPVNRTVSTVAIILLLGYLPPVWGWAKKRAGQAAQVEDASRSSALGAAVLLMFGEVLWWLGVVVTYAIIAIPGFAVVATLSSLIARTPWLEPDTTLATPVFTVLFVATIVFTFSDTHPRSLLDPRRAIPEIGAGLLLGAGNIVPHLAGLSIGAVVAGAGPMELLYDRLGLAMAAAALSGVLLGLTIYRIERDPYLGFLIELGHARCDVRLGRFGRARHRIGVLDFSPAKTETGDYLIGCLSVILGRPDTPDVVKRLNQTLDEAQRWSGGVWATSVAATRQLVADIGAGAVPGIHLRRW